jgi:hypothetical protein
MSTPVNRFQFGRQTISTRVFMMMPQSIVSRRPWVDVTAAMEDQPRERAIRLTEVGANDPFAEVKV